MIEIVNISPRGYCYGVVDAMVIARNASLDPNLPRPIHILGMIVHNEHITKAFEEVGIYTLSGTNRQELLDQIDTGTVIFTAHGTAPHIIQAAKEKGLVTIDATCPDVLITHELLKEKITQGYDILYIGKKNHPEPEGAIGINPEKIHLIETMDDLEHLSLHNPKIFVTNQTTMSQWDVADLMISIQHKYPQAQLHKDICQATQVRQEAVVAQAKGCDLTLVVGDPNSNNSNRLAQVSIEQANVPAYRIADVSEIDPSWLIDVKKVAVTAGASTPTQLVREVLQFLERVDPKQPTSPPKSQVNFIDLLPKPRIKDISEKRKRRMQVLRVEMKERLDNEK